MTSLAGRLFGERKGGVWSGPLGTLIGDWIRESDTDVMAGASDEQAMRVAAVSTCVRLISQTVASFPLHMYERLDDGGRRRVPPTNTLEQRLQQPNPWQGPMSFREQLQAGVLLRGAGFAWINWTKELVPDDTGRRVLVDRVVELIPIHPDRMEVERKQWKDPPRYFVRTDVGVRQELPADEVFHLPGLSFDGAHGRGVIQDARESIGVALGTQRYARKFWQNDATPGVVLTTDQALTPEQAEEIRERFDEQHTQNARRTAVLGKGAKIDRLTLSAEDSQFLETRKFQRAEIAGLFLVPPHMIGDVDRSTSWGTGIEQQQIGFLVYTIRPWLIRWEQAIQRCLINRADRYYAEHNVAALLRGDIRSQSAAFATGINWGWWSPNDVRRMLNENPREGGDAYLQPSNMTASGSNPAEEALRAEAAQAGGASA